MILRIIRESIWCLVIIFPLAGWGSDLSRGKAENILKAYLLPKYVTAWKDQQKPQYYRFELASSFPINGPGVKEENVRELERRGLLALRYQTRIEYGLDTGSYILYYEFTAAASPYLIKTDSDKLLVAVAEVDSIYVTGVSRPSELFGKTICEAHYNVHYKPTPFGEVLLGPEDPLIENLTRGFELYDDGWRMEGERLAQPRSKVVSILSILEGGIKPPMVWIIIITAIIIIALIIVGILAKTRWSSGRVGAGLVCNTGKDTLTKSHIYCTQCGEKNDAGAFFCISCGARLER
jgi:hypothetical protein